MQENELVARVERKARQLAEVRGMRWDWIGENMRELFRDDARSAIRAATLSKEREND